MDQSQINKRMAHFDERSRIEDLPSPQMVQKTKANRYPNLTIKLFEVQSEATGDGVYNCYEQTLDATEWGDTAGDSKIDDKNTDSIEVLNLAEFDPEGTYVAHLAAGDLIAAWQKLDDEGNKRWVGLPLRQANADRPRMAICAANAGSGSTIAAELDKSGGTAIIVHCMVSPSGANLEDCIRNLNSGDPIIVRKLIDKDGNDYWWAVEGFQEFDDTKGLYIDSDKLAVNIDTTKGLEFANGKVAVNINTDELQFDSGEIKTKLDECPLG